MSRRPIGASWPLTSVSQFDDLDFGWVVGLGIEHAWTDNWLVRAEGFYYDLGSEDGEVSNSEETDSFEVDQEIWVGRIGVSHKFN